MFHFYDSATTPKLCISVGLRPNTMQCCRCYNAASIAWIMLVAVVGAGVKASWVYTAGGGRRGGVPMWATESGVEVNSLLLWLIKNRVLKLLSAGWCHLIKSMQSAVVPSVTRARKQDGTMPLFWLKGWLLKVVLVHHEVTALCCTVVLHILSVWQTVPTVVSL